MSDTPATDPTAPADHVAARTGHDHETPGGDHGHPHAAAPAPEHPVEHPVEHPAEHAGEPTTAPATASAADAHHEHAVAPEPPPEDVAPPASEPTAEPLAADVHEHEHPAPEPHPAPAASGEPEAAPAPEPVAEGPTHEPTATGEAVKTDEPTPPKSAKKSRTSKAKAPAAPAAADTPGVTEPEAAPAEPAEPTDTVTPTHALEPAAEPVPESKKKWYAIKVQSGREDTIKAAILRKVRIEGLEEFFGRIEIPVEEVSEKKTVKVKDKKTGETTFQEKKVTRKRKKFQGYLFAELEFNDRILYLFRETSGVGDFLNLRQRGSQLPTPEPMPEHEVQSMLTGLAVKDPNKKVKIRLDFEKGDKVRVREGSFANSEGEVKTIIDAKDPNEAPKVSVELTFWGRPLVVEFDSNQVEKV
jgi:transcriptional antiterminator NusG